MALDSIVYYHDNEPVFKNNKVTIYSELAKVIYHLKQPEHKRKYLPANAHATHEIRVQKTINLKKSQCIGVVYLDSKGDFWLVKTEGREIVYCDYLLSEKVVQLGKDGCLIPAQFRETNAYDRPS